MYEVNISNDMGVMYICTKYTRKMFNSSDIHNYTFATVYKKTVGWFCIRFDKET